MLPRTHIAFSKHRKKDEFHALIHISSEITW